MNTTTRTREKDRPLVACRACGGIPTASLLGPFTVVCSCGIRVGPFDRKSQARLAWQAKNGLPVLKNEQGRLIGHSHPNATLTNEQVSLIHSLHDEGWGWRRIAAKLPDLSHWTIKDICDGASRSQIPALPPYTRPRVR